MRASTNRYKRTTTTTDYHYFGRRRHRRGSPHFGRLGFRSSRKPGQIVVSLHASLFAFLPLHRKPPPRNGGHWRGCCSGRRTGEWGQQRRTENQRMNELTSTICLGRQAARKHLGPSLTCRGTTVDFSCAGLVLTRQGYPACHTHKPLDCLICAC